MIGIDFKHSYNEKDINFIIWEYDKKSNVNDRNEHLSDILDSFLNFGEYEKKWSDFLIREKVIFKLTNRWELLPDGFLR